MKTLRHRRHSAWMLAAALLVPLAAQSLPAPWKELDAKSIPLVGARLIAPSKARYFVVAPGTFEAAFKRAAPIAGKAPPPTLRLPMPDGRELSFSVVQTEVMAPELAAKYPSIKTYAGSAANHPEITGRFQMDPRGFRAMIFTPEGRVFVDPFSIGDTRHYQVYYQHDLARRSGSADPRAEARRELGILRPAQHPQAWREHLQHLAHLPPGAGRDLSVFELP